MDHQYCCEMGKTKAPVSIKIQEQACKILNLYIEAKKVYNDYVFPLMEEADPRDVFKRLKMQ